MVDKNNPPASKLDRSAGSVALLASCRLAVLEESEAGFRSFSRNSRLKSPYFIHFMPRANIFISHTCFPFELPKSHNIYDVCYDRLHQRRWQ